VREKQDWRSRVWHSCGLAYMDLRDPTLDSTKSLMLLNIFKRCAANS